MNIYIASSWKNQHGVQMLTEAFRAQGHTVTSWIENNYGEGNTGNESDFNFEDWMHSPGAQRAFIFDSKGAMECNLLVYYGNAGKDAAAECGMAYARNVPVIGLRSKGEDFGLMRKMFSGWFTDHRDLLQYTAHVPEPVINDDLPF